MSRHSPIDVVIPPDVPTVTAFPLSFGKSPSQVPEYERLSFEVVTLKEPQSWREYLVLIPSSGPPLSSRQRDFCIGAASGVAKARRLRIDTDASKAAFATARAAKSWIGRGMAKMKAKWDINGRRYHGRMLS